MTSSLRSAVLSRSYTLSPVQGAVPAARTWVRQMLDRWGLQHFTERAELLVSELATNAIKHAKADGAPIRVTLTYENHTLLLEVHDRDASSLPVPQQPVIDEEGGRGLFLVEAYADRWDVKTTAYGKAVRCELIDGEPT
ncbi:ATP-binding protein [Nonomuraea sp. NPDC059194]|uniref:ATP-binding protein n=1 Tax=Nonomuraea sp. NPDC059194 TaxID=3346764 RepID=UPI0036D0E9CF